MSIKREKINKQNSAISISTVLKTRCKECIFEQIFFVMQVNFRKQVLPHLVAVLGFFLISIAYFSPTLNNQRLQQHDWKVYQASSKEYKDVKQETGETTLWTNSMFSGMPNYLIVSPLDKNIFAKIGKFINFGNWRPVAHLFYYLLGFFLLL